MNFAILGREEKCTGDSARRLGDEFLFQELAQENIATLARYHVRQIVTPCPHCLNSLVKDYPQFGGNYEVIHHTQFINELVGAGKIQLSVTSDQLSVTFHDPCYLSRHNKITDAPRNMLHSVGMLTIEMPRNSDKSFCCGAGGAQMWKEEENGTARVNEVRYAEAKSTGAKMVAVGCPFCLTMLNDASKADGDSMQVKDVVEIVAERME